MPNKDGSWEGFKLMPAPPDTCQECAVKHSPKQPHNAQSLFYQYDFRSKRGRWPTWKDAVAHCADHIQDTWKKALQERGAWTEPKSEAPDVCPTEDRTIGTVTRIPIEHPKKNARKKGRTKGE